MAKSPTELIRDLTAQVSVLSERDTTRRTEVESLQTRIKQEIEERKTTDQKHQDEITVLRRELAELRQENAVLKQQLHDHIKRVDLADSRRWSLIVLLIGAVLSLASGLIVTLVRK